MTKRGRPRSERLDAIGVSLKVSPSAWEGFNFLAKEIGVTRSELVEMLGNREISLDTASRQQMVK
jgi:hypothetical protein